MKIELQETPDYTQFVAVDGAIGPTRPVWRVVRKRRFSSREDFMLVVFDTEGDVHVVDPETMDIVGMLMLRDQALAARIRAIASKLLDPMRWRTL